MDTGTASPPSLADISRQHRERWLDARCPGRDFLSLADSDDPAATLQAALDEEHGATAVSWLDGVPIGALESGIRAALRAAAIRGWIVVVAVPGVPLSLTATPVVAEDEGTSVARALAGDWPAAEVREQHLAEGSLIAAERPEGTSARLLGDRWGDPAAAHALIVCANLPEDDAGEGRELELGARPIHRGYLLALEAANQELRRANTRLARKWLGVHDAAAGSIIGRLEAAARDAQEALHRSQEALHRSQEALHRSEGQRRYLEQQVEIEQGVARQNHEYFEAYRTKLHEPHHRVAEGLVRRMHRLPGGRAVGRAVQRRLPDRS